MGKWRLAFLCPRLNMFPCFIGHFNSFSCVPVITLPPLLDSSVYCFKEAECLLMWPQMAPSFQKTCCWLNLNFAPCHIDSLGWSERLNGVMFFWPLNSVQLYGCRPPFSQKIHILLTHPKLLITWPEDLLMNSQVAYVICIVYCILKVS